VNTASPSSPHPKAFSPWSQCKRHPEQRGQRASEDMFTECSTPRTPTPEALTPRVLHSGKDTGRSDIDGTETTHPLYRTESVPKWTGSRASAERQNPSPQAPESIYWVVSTLPLARGVLFYFGSIEPGCVVLVADEFEPVCSWGVWGAFAPYPMRTTAQTMQPPLHARKSPADFGLTLIAQKKGDVLSDKYSAKGLTNCLKCDRIALSQ
jgi:hypothetical protein